MRHRATAKALARWRGETRTNARRRSVLARAIERFARRSLHHAWDGWVERAAEARRLRAAAKRVATRLANRLECAAFERWVEFAAERRRANAVARKSAVRIRYYRESAAFRRWSSEAREMRRRRALVRRFASRWARRTQAAAFDRWVAFYDECATRRATLASVVHRVTRRGLGSAFNAWVRWFDDRRALRRVATRAVARLADRRKSAAFGAWADGSAARARGRAVARRAAAHWTRTAAASAFRKWREGSAGASARAREDAPVRRAVDGVGEGARVPGLGRVLAASIARVVRREQPLRRETSDGDARRLRGVEGVALRIVGAHAARVRSGRAPRLPRGSPRSRVRRLASLLLGVRSASAPTRRRTKRAPERIGPRHLGRLGERAEGGEFRAERVDAPALARARRAWREWTAKRERDRATARKCVLRMSARKKHAAFATWREEAATAVADRRREARIVERIARRWRDKTLAGAFDGWRWRASDVVRRRNLLRRAALRLSRRFVASAFDAWRGDVADIRGFKVLRERYARILDSMLRRRLHAAFYRWDDAVYERRRARVAVARALGRLRNRTAGAAFGAWRRRARDRVAHRAKLRRGDHAVQKALAKMRRRWFAAAFYAWSGASREARARAAAEKKAARFFAAARRAKAGAAFRGWRFAAFERLREKRVAVAVVRRAAADDGVRRAFRTWLDVARGAAAARIARRRTEANARRILRRVVTRELRAGFAGWSFAVAERRRLRAALRGAAAKWARRSLASAFATWADAVEASAAVRRAYARHARIVARLAGRGSVARLTGGAKRRLGKNARGGFWRGTRRGSGGSRRRPRSGRG